MNTIFHKQFEICSYDVDVNQKVKISKLFGFFQEVAWLHAQQLRFGYFDLLQEHGAFWALSRLHMQIDAYPMWNDVVEYRTWPVESNRLFARRDFEIYVGEKRIGYGTSDWIIASFKDRHLLEPQRILNGLKFNYQQGLSTCSTKRLKPLSNYETSCPRQTRYNDLDMNKHVNSIRYLDWVLDCLPSTFLNEKAIQTLNINYLHEIPSERKVEIHYQHNDKINSRYHFLGKDKEAKQTSFLMELDFM